MLTKSTVTSFKTDGLQEGEFIAYPSTFTRTPDDYGDVVAKGAFTDTIKDWKQSGKVLPVMYMHKMDDPNYNIGAVEDMGEDDHGWWIRAKLDDDNPIAQRVHELIKAGRLSQMSFAFDVLDAAPVKIEDGTEARELRKVKVYEASVVPVGANQDTSIEAIKSAPEELEDGQALSAANRAFLENLMSQMSNIVAQLQAFLGQKAGDMENIKSSDANAHLEAKTEELKEAKVEEPKARALELATQIAIALDDRKE